MSDAHRSCELHCCYCGVYCATCCTRWPARRAPRADGRGAPALDICDDQFSLCQGDDDLDAPRFRKTIRVLIDYEAHLPEYETVGRRPWTAFTRSYYAARQAALLGRKQAAVALYLVLRTSYPRRTAGHAARAGARGDARWVAPVDVS